MLEKKTVQRLNELIICMTDHCIKEYEKGVYVEDLKILTSLVEAVGGANQTMDFSPVIGFLADQSDNGEDASE
ncbi:hypothetical protein EBB07_33870 [Paenibacillaceae bacterium]|nr:hypothetical protein EBB07_33870 [Paenibacillaceae bacterium]